MATPSLTFRNVTVIDGSGSSGFLADVAVSEGRIASVGEAATGAREVDGRGLVLCPGFVDVHSHDDTAFIRFPHMAFKLAQGVTSEISGNCGSSAAPHDPSQPPRPGDLAAGADWLDLAGYFAACEAANPAINNAMLVGHNKVRYMVMGMEARTASADEVALMRALVAGAMEQGAAGFSTGLIYEPGRYSDTAEVVALAAESGSRGGLYATHMRNEGDKLLEAVDEALHIAREARCGLHISHHKSAGRRNWGRVGESLAKVDAANASGMDVTLDVYPYTAGSGPMNQYFNLNKIDIELAANIRIAYCPDRPDFQGRMLTEICEEHGWGLDEGVRQAVTGPRGKETVCIQFIIDEADIATNLRHPRMMVGSDGIPVLKGSPHPRLYGTMPRILSEYVRERGVLTLEDAIHRMTQMSCERFGLAGRGLVREGYWADLVLFDPRIVRDTATYDDPQREPEGIRMVVVNGEVALESGHHTGVGAGRMLRYRSGD
ncbi:MAG: N-acyl-D-amino-acid deacylase family protein [Dehalococcoidia bacterium]